MSAKNPNKPHILFLFSDTGGGHRSATEAIIEALQLEFDDRITTEMVDFFRDYTPWPFYQFPELYPRMVKAPRVWGAGYVLSNGRRRANMLIRFSRGLARSSFKRLFEEHPCDLVVSVHPLASDAVIQALGSPRPAFSVVVTDMVSTHAFWYHRKVDLTIVPTQPAYERAMRYGLDPAQVRLIGMPVADRFCTPSGTKKELRERLGWPQNLPMVVLVGGGDGMGPLEQTALAIDQANLRLGLAVIAGRNQTLKERLESHAWKMPIYTYGFVRNMPDFMRAADILVTKAGPGTISEAMNAGLPMILYSYLPGQESGNVNYVVEKGAGVWAPKPEQVTSALEKWLADPASFQQVVAACNRLARPNAAREIARELAAQVGLTSGERVVAAKEQSL